MTSTTTPSSGLCAPTSSSTSKASSNSSKRATAPSNTTPLYPCAPPCTKRTPPSKLQSHCAARQRAQRWVPEDEQGSSIIAGWRSDPVTSIRHSKLDRGGSRNPRPAHWRLVNHCSMRPLRCRHIIHLAPHLRHIQPVLRVRLIQSCQVRHHVRRLARPLRNQHVHSRRRRSRSGLRILNHHRVHRLVRHRDGRNFPDLQSRAQQLDSRSAQRIAFQQRNLQLPLPQAQHHVRLLRHFHQQARRRCLPHHHVNGLVAVDSVRHAQHQPARLQHLARLGYILAHQIRHRHLAPVNRDAHRRDRAQKRRRRQDEH